MTPAASHETAGRRTPRVAIIGAGMAGIGMGAQLCRAGIRSFRIYEKRADIGGTWYANTYPGLTCDIASHYYSYSFAPNPDWTHFYSPGPEILAYLRKVSGDFGLRENLSLSTEVTEVKWVDGRWIVRTREGEVSEYDFVVAATGGVYSDPVRPEIPGLESFAGSAFHSAEWDHSVPLPGRRIAVIGTGATGLQLTRSLAPVASRFELYQRTPQWIFPLMNHRYTSLARWCYRQFPPLNRLSYRAWQLQLEQGLGRGSVAPGLSRWGIKTACQLHLRTVRDRDLRRRLTPDYEPMCKRLLQGTGFYRQFKRSTVELVDTEIDHVAAKGIVTSDGRLHELDVIIFATGFDSHAYLGPIDLVGPDGTRLSELWENQSFGYRSVALPGFPNFFMLIGPHSPLGNQSLFAIAETQIEYALAWIDLWRSGEFEAMAPTQEATKRFNDAVQEAIPGTVWASGCDSWYIGQDGRPDTWPWRPERHRKMLKDLHAEDWETTSAAPSSAAGGIHDRAQS